jgi:hypothetical protein
MFKGHGDGDTLYLARILWLACLKVLDSNLVEHALASASAIIALFRIGTERFLNGRIFPHCRRCVRLRNGLSCKWEDVITCSIIFRKKWICENKCLQIGSNTNFLTFLRR